MCSVCLDRSSQEVGVHLCIHEYLKCVCVFTYFWGWCVCMHFWLCSSAILSMLSLSGMELVDLVTLGEQWANACCMLNNLEAYACVCMCGRACACLCVSIQTWLCIISMDWSWAELDNVKEHNDKENVCMRMLVCLSSRWQSISKTWMWKQEHTWIELFYLFYTHIMNVVVGERSTNVCNESCCLWNVVFLKGWGGIFNLVGKLTVSCHLHSRSGESRQR